MTTIKLSSGRELLVDEPIDHIEACVQHCRKHPHETPFFDATQLTRVERSTPMAQLKAVEYSRTPVRVRYSQVEVLVES